MSVCNRYSNIRDMCGMFFDISSNGETNIFLDPSLTIQEIFDLQNRLELSNNLLENGTIQDKNTELNNLRPFYPDGRPNYPDFQTKLDIQNEFISGGYIVSTISSESLSYNLIDNN